MLFATPQPFRQALDAVAVRTKLPTALTSAEMQRRVEAEVRERALFSARVTQAEILDGLEAAVRAVLEGEMTLSGAARELQRLIRSLGYEPEAGARGGLTDLGSDPRVNLMVEQNVASAAGYGRWAQGQDEAILDEWPAEEFLRLFPRKVPRTDWPERFNGAGGEEREGRMVALKNSGVWPRLSRFGVPYPPFDFNSGMGLRDVTRDEAERLGLLTPQEHVQPQDRGFNDDLQYSPEIRAGALRQALLEAGGLRFDEQGVLHLANDAAPSAPPSDGGVMLDLIVDCILLPNAGDWAESEHPRGSHGRFVTSVHQEKVGRTGTAESLGLPADRALPPVSGAPVGRLSQQEGEGQLRAGVRVIDPLGREVHFGSRALEHFTKGNNPQRARFLAAALQAVRHPAEVWSNDGARHFYVGVFRRPEGGTLGHIVVGIRTDETHNDVLTYVPKQSQELKGTRQGRLLYVGY